MSIFAIKQMHFCSPVHRWSNETVVLKIYKPALLHVISQHQLMRETRLHVELDHPNIVHLYAAFKQVRECR